MGALAALLREAGDEVSGSDVAFDPPVGPMLRALGVRCVEGYDAAHLDPRPDLVVVGNAIRRTNPEAQAVEALALAGALARTSMSAALRERFLAKRRPLVVAGTHGKTTTSAMCAWLLSRAGYRPGVVHRGRAQGPARERRHRVDADPPSAGPRAVRRRGRRVRRGLLAQAAEVLRLRRRRPRRRRDRHERRARPHRHLPGRGLVRSGVPRVRPGGAGGRPRRLRRARRACSRDRVERGARDGSRGTRSSATTRAT